MKKVGLIVNPIAGLGGSVGLKGTDGLEILEKARKMGANPTSPIRTKKMLDKLKFIKNEIIIYTCSGEMGENVAREFEFEIKIINQIGKHTTSDDTKIAAKKMLDLEVDLLIFVGGDGTARDIYSSIQENLIVLGIPAGVKMHSAVYATTPELGGELAILYLQGKIASLKSVEVMDIDENAFREGRVSAELFGFLKVPYQDRFIQGMKIGRGISDESSIDEIAQFVIDQMEKDIYYIVGPGSTTKSILKKIGITTNLLGVDVIINKKLYNYDVNEKFLLDLVTAQTTKIIVTIIGGQGYIFGRGNQQISSSVLKIVGKENVIVIATQNKLLSLFGKPLRVDTGDEEINNNFKGYIKVIDGYKELVVMRVE